MIRLSITDKSHCLYIAAMKVA